MPGRGRGRPTKYTPKTIEKILYAIRLGSPQRYAAAAAGVGESTYHEWKVSYPEFAEAVKTAESEGISTWLSIIEKAAKEGNWQAAAWKLERRYYQDFARRDRLQVDVAALDAEIEQRLAELASGSEAAIAGALASEAIQ